MPNHKSASKRMRQNEIRRVRNKAVRTRVKNSVKAIHSAINSNSSAADISTLLSAAVQTIGKASSKNVMPKKRASRKISRITKMVNGYSQTV